MRISPKACDHASGPVRMKRIYERIKKDGKYTFVQCGWLCPDCSQFKKDN